jgi:hypothetical protein
MHNPWITDFCTSWRRVVSFTSRPLYPQGNSPRHPLSTRLGGPQSWFVWHVEEKIITSIGTWTPTSRPPSPLPVAIATALTRLLTHTHIYISINQFIVKFVIRLCPLNNRFYGTQTNTNPLKTTAYGYLHTTKCIYIHVIHIGCTRKTSLKSRH